MRSRASVENEQNVIYLETARGEIVFKQIAGWVARRVVCWKSPGDLGGAGRAYRLDSVRFAHGRVVARGRRDPGAAGAACGRRGERTGAMAMSRRANSRSSGSSSRSNHRLRRGIYLLPSACYRRQPPLRFLRRPGHAQGRRHRSGQCRARHRLCHSVRRLRRFRRPRHAHEHRIRQAVRFPRGHGQLRHCPGDSGFHLGRAGAVGRPTFPRPATSINWRGWSAWPS